ncbi:HAD family hydrolase [uncultured Treponema sp.]|uniref:HAD family hydrolase n=1 Tax=uncultured Treponema sp. TaxID=162155 RepID=UPI0025CB944E|nr:HAD family hydrolase [uncultured Treponema sp.]
MFEGIEAVAFDIDGTLYPSWRLYLLMPLYVIKHFKFYLHYNKIRKILHRTAPLSDFYEFQARLFAEETKLSVDESKKIINEVCYEGIKIFFKKIKPYSHAVECIKAMKSAGLKIGILSDFPPSQKGDIWGIKQLCDVCIGSEESGALKPSVYPFGILSRKLDVPPEKILYVGNSKKYDVLGANNAKMKSAYILTGFRRLFGIKLPDADISFKNYRQLEKIVLK